MAKKVSNNTQASVHTISEEMELMAFLQKTYTAKSRNELKGLLQRNCVLVDNQAISQYNYALKVGQTVQLSKVGQAKSIPLSGLKIVHEDEHLIVVDKQAGLLTIATAKQKEVTAYHIISSYLKQKDGRNRVFIVHRLDRDTSGLLLFAKNEETQQALQEHWNDQILERNYTAVVEGQIEKPMGRISSYLAENKAFIMYSTPNKAMGKEAITHYEVLKSNRKYSLLNVQLETGRKNQIRVHMQDIGHPIIGDDKYGAKSNPIRRMGLHATVLSFVHPASNQVLRFESDIPKSFVALLGN